ncbi:HEPN domain-containing protein [Caballeronia udeis]|uniref:hypothetical protein n=1 Tax=Caballeronia udeis TaxID=1232866 RepID=UPI0012E95417|nr:hypothetical protein [Caballeronia udeis]
MTKKDNPAVSTYELAVSYRASADLLVDQLSDCNSLAGHKIFPMFLYSHAVELFLKEYLRLKNHHAEKPFRHDLRRLWHAAKREGIELRAPHNMDGLIALLESGHEDYQFRYSEKVVQPFGAKLDTARCGKVGQCSNVRTETPASRKRENVRQVWGRDDSGNSIAHRFNRS